ncbi:hypothetical protein [Hwangdonia seohaensis]|uniref:Apea-like HEPN domain-containing protein n=1 Tax=Hwangdonia seohaensis TaxID=1240727 RepID=A0ABW3RD11_9FLAO|nr:hypothetical protein [Hwangdonia seohaensis]
MKRGILYKLVSYPSLITLKKGFGLHMNHEGYDFTVRVQQHVKALQILDYNNDIIVNKISDKKTESTLKTNKIKELSKKELFIQIENSKLIIETIGSNCNSFRTRDITNLLFGIEVEDIENVNSVQDKFDDILKYFLKIYRIKSGDIHTKFPEDLNEELLVIREGRYLYLQEDLDKKISERLNSEMRVAIGIKSLKMPTSFTIGSKKNLDFDKNGEVIKEFVKSNSKISQIDEFHLKAREEFYVNNNYKYAILELFTMIEVLIVDKLTKYKLANGVSNKKLKEFKKNIPISYLINVELPLILNNITNDDRKVLSQIDSIRKIRNEIVHENKKLTKVECEFAFKAVNDFFDVLRKNQL